MQSKILCIVCKNMQKNAKTCSSPMNIFPLHMDGIIVCKIYKNEHKYAKYARVKFICKKCNRPVTESWPPACRPLPIAPAAVLGELEGQLWRLLGGCCVKCTAACAHRHHNIFRVCQAADGQGPGHWPANLDAELLASDCHRQPSRPRAGYPALPDRWTSQWHGHHHGDPLPLIRCGRPACQ